LPRRLAQFWPELIYSNPVIILVTVRGSRLSLLPPMKYCWIRHMSIVQDSSLLTRSFEFDPCLSFNVVVRSLKPTKDHQLGALLETPTT